VIATAREMPGAYAVVDDALGRKCALALGVEVIGTVGMVVAAQRRGVIADARAVLLELRRAGMRLSDDVIARALRIAVLRMLR
jgi:predicted nucleic acid-binding protein